ncbi:hypothetical protein J2Y69_002469 [Microbacterium resistens]|uniref:Secreted protein n=1 Tax=Microbacterium resistens TaxID=156977 RepID=A0ABU1SE38_9MICO|nr:hypothetical protein [Microbacterium resistens]MDR6867861.1 hypothetical protein [Microbacterium resistens]
MSDIIVRESQPKDVSRRTIVKSAAWAVPVVAAASAMPMAAASTPACPSCIKAGLPVVGGIIGGLWTLQAAVAGNRGIIGMPNMFGLDATGCGIDFQNIFQPAFTFVITQATLTMSDNRTYNSTVGLGVGGGNISTVGAFPAGFVFNNVLLPSGGSIGGIPPYPVAPRTLTVTVRTTLQYGIGLSIECPMTLTWNLNGVATGLVLLGTGSVNFSGTATV